MCGIMAGDLEQLKAKNLKTLCNNIDHRGKDSYGYLVWSNGQWDDFTCMTLKHLLKSLNRLDSSSYVIIHNRATSIGGTTLKLAHPITKEEGNKKVSVIHNGTNKSVYAFVEAADSDTEALAMLSLKVPFKKDIYKLAGNVGVVFTVDDYSVPKVHLHKDKIRPLVQHVQTSIIASEPLFDGEWVLVDDQDTMCTIENGNLKGLKLLKDTAQELVIDDANYCYVCNKMHIEVEGSYECAICTLKGDSGDYYQMMGWRDSYTNTTPKTKVATDLTEAEINYILAGGDTDDSTYADVIEVSNYTNVYSVVPGTTDSHRVYGYLSINDFGDYVVVADTFSTQLFNVCPTDVVDTIFSSDSPHRYPSTTFNLKQYTDRGMVDFVECYETYSSTIPPQSLWKFIPTGNDMVLVPYEYDYQS